MATATTEYKTKVVERVIKEEVAEAEIVLRLTKEEAGTLYSLTYCNVIGSPETSYRAHTDAIHNALARYANVSVRRFNGTVNAVGMPS